MAINASKAGSTYTVGTVRYSSIYSGELRVKINSIDVAANKSNITVSWIYKKNDTDPYKAWNLETSAGVLRINGTSYSFNDADFDLRNAAVGATQTLMTKTLDITHTAEGSKTIEIGGTHSTGLSWGSKSVSNTAVNLPAIPRASTISSVTAEVMMDGNSACTVNISRASAAFTHKVVFACGGKSYTVSGATTTASYKIPISWCGAVTSNTMGAASVTVTTYNGSVKIGSAVSKAFKVKVPAGVVPSFTAITATRIDNTVPAAWGVYVQGKSGVKLAVTGAAGAYGSGITGYKISGGGYSSAASSFTINKLSGSGVITFTATVTDSRGRKTSKAVSITVQPYDAPKFLTGTSCFRCDADGVPADEGACLSVKAVGGVSSCASKNTMALKFRYRMIGGSYGGYTALTGGAATLVNEISIDNSYDVELSCTDAFTTVVKVFSISTSASVLDLHRSGKGMAIGKAAETENLLDVAYDALIRGSLESRNLALNNGAGTASLDFRRVHGDTGTRVRVAPYIANNTNPMLGIPFYRDDVLVGRIYMAYNSFNPRNADGRMTLGNSGNPWLDVFADKLNGMSAKVQSGTVSMPMVANQVSSKDVTFPVAFSKVPAVVASPVSTVPDILSPVGVGNLTTTGFTLYLRRANANTTGVRWVAVEPA